MHHYKHLDTVERHLKTLLIEKKKRKKERKKKHHDMLPLLYKVIVVFLS